MPSQADIDQFMRTNIVGVNDTTTLIPKMPPLPDDVKKRFPSMEQWEHAVEDWRVKLNIALRGV